MMVDGVIPPDGGAATRSMGAEQSELAAAGAPELGQDRDGRELADAEVPLQGATAGPAAGKGAQLHLERLELLVDVVNQRQRGRDHGACGVRQLELGELRAAYRRQEPRGLGHPVVEELRLDALLPGGALVDER